MLTNSHAVSRDDSIAGMIAAHSADSLALASRSFRLTYGQLNERTGALAQGLHLLGIGPDVPVPVYAYRSAAGIVGALSVIKSGGAYVPLDPADPAPRLESILRDLQAPFVLAERGLAGRLPPGAWKVIPMDEAPLIFSQPMEAPVAPRPDSLAAISYVSGSTGRPIGVELTHANLLHLIRWHQRAFQITAADNAAQLAPFGHEAAIWEIWPYLAAGASLHFTDAHAGGSMRLLRNWLTDEYITVAFAPPEIAEQLMALEWPRTTALRYLLTGGDLLRRYPPAGLPFQVVNHYGQAEVTVVATSGIVPAKSRDDLPPIGRPIEGMRAVILDEQSNLVREGMPGELCLSGPGLARGYWNQPELTARKFIQDLYRTDAHARLYRTGTLVRRLPDGQLACIGRLDNQINIRGFRVEPAEIESALNTCREVGGSLVLAHEDKSGERYLVAYVTPAEGREVSAAALEEWLHSQLPDHMGPDAIMVLEQFPLTAEGRVDRTALPAPPCSRAKSAARQNTEIRLGRIVSTLLSAREIDSDTNFLQLDTHPLLGALVLDRVHDAFGVTITSRQLYAAPTISGLAAAIEEAQS